MLFRSKVLKIAHEKFTWSGKEIPHIGSYGGHKWHGFWLKDLDAQEAFPLSTVVKARRSCGKHKSWGIHTSIHVIKTTMLSSL